LNKSLLNAFARRDRGGPGWDIKEMTNTTLPIDTSISLSADLETATCPICGPAASAVTRYDFDPYRVVACSSCGLNYLSPRLTQEAILKLYKDEAYYNSNISGQGYDEYLEISDNWIKDIHAPLKANRSLQIIWPRIGHWLRPGLLPYCCPKAGI